MPNKLPEYPRSYRLTTGRWWFEVIGGGIMALLALALLFGGNGEPQSVAQLLMRIGFGGGFLAFCVYCVLDAIRFTVTIDEHSVTVRRGLRSKTLPLSEVKSRQLRSVKGTRYIYFMVRGRFLPFDIPLVFAPDTAFNNWLNRIPENDARNAGNDADRNI